MSKFAPCLLLLCWCAVSHSAGDPTGTKCEAVEGAPSCVCKSQKGVIDLTKIANFDGTPRFKGLKDPNGYSYDYNPCDSFKGPHECSTGVQVCQYYEFGYYAITDPGTEAIWIDNDGEPYVYYTGPGQREVMVHLVCDPSATEPEVTAEGESDQVLLYEFTVRSVHACPSGNGTLPIEKCKAVEGAPSCVCKTPDGTIDLTKIASYNGTPRFTGIFDPNKFSYDYNPCLPFSATKSCSDVHREVTSSGACISCDIQVCQKAEGNITYAIGDSGSEIMGIDKSTGKVFAHYTGPDGREAFVYLNCNQTERGDPILTTTGDSEVASHYEFQLTSCHVCPGGCSNKTFEKI